MGTITSFEDLYNPILGASDGHSQEAQGTPIEKLERTAKLKEVYNDLKTDLLDEVNMMDSRVIQPATDAKECLQPIRKTIKKRENKKLDWERYSDRVSHAQKKPKRTDRENVALAKAEEEAARAGEVSIPRAKYVESLQTGNKMKSRSFKLQMRTFKRPFHP